MGWLLHANPKDLLPCQSFAFFYLCAKTIPIFFKQTFFAFVALPTCEKVGRVLKDEFCSLAVLLRPTSYMLSHQWCFVKVSLLKRGQKDCFVNNNR